jgi:alpha-L-fucosidase
MKSLKECIQTLVKTAGGNGNLLFNVGPMMDGRIESRQVDRLKAMGDWLKLYGESIYGTQGGPYAPGAHFATTRKGNRLYVHVFSNNMKELRLPGLAGAKVLNAQFLHGAKVSFTQDTAGSLTLTLPAVLPDENDSVIALTLDGDAGLIPLVETK